MYHIAVCDDEENTLKYICSCREEILTEAHIKHKIEAFSAIKELERKLCRFDLLITDIELNGENGLETVKRLRAEGSFFKCNIRKRS